MWQKIWMLPVKAHTALTGFVEDLKNDERGLSGVVVTVLLILVAIFAVVLLWSLLGEWISDFWETITEQADDFAESGGGGDE